MNKIQLSDLEARALEIFKSCANSFPHPDADPLRMANGFVAIYESMWLAENDPQGNLNKLKGIKPKN